jgi:hypothetical protein
MKISVVMTSDEYGEETFPRDTLETAAETVQALRESVDQTEDGVIRDIYIRIDD